MRVLAVDDDELMLELLVLSLEQEGFTNVTTTGSARAALDLLESLESGSEDGEPGAFDCFLFDIQMPGMDGIELCGKVRALPQYSRTPILMVTSLSDRKHIEEAFMAGATDYVTKPFDQVELASRMRVANTLALEQRRGLYEYFMTSIMDVCLEDERAALFQSPVTIEGVENVVDFKILENHILQLSRKGLHDNVVIAFHDVGAAEAFSKNTFDWFFERLTSIAKILSEAMKSTEYLMSYFGCGNFVCVMDRKNYNSDDNFLKKLHEFSMKGAATTAESGPPIIVGDPVFNTTFATLGVRTILLDAVSSAIEKSLPGGPSGRKLRALRPRAAKFNLPLNN